MAKELISISDLYVLIGNGFDLECGLPTKYKDFLQFLISVENITDSVELKYKNLNPEILKKLSDSDLTLWDAVLHSFWFYHFMESIESIRGGWLDFENEIDHVVAALERSMTLPDGKRLTMDDAVRVATNGPLNDEFSEYLTDVDVQFSQSQDGYTEYQITYQELAKRLYDDLEEFVFAFERYLKDYVSIVEPRVTGNIEALIYRIERSTRRHVLSFNYTDTFEKMLRACGIEAQYCYIHGKIGNAGRNNMVLGIDEHQTGKEYIPFAPFCKYNQRIFKETDSSYMDWLSFFDDKAELRRGLIIFGHSLGLSDRDVLRAFIMGKRMETTIFYHGYSTFSRVVGNLTEMIGRDEMIKRNGGRTRTMTFIKQEKCSGIGGTV